MRVQTLLTQDQLVGVRTTVTRGRAREEGALGDVVAAAADHATGIRTAAPKPNCSLSYQRILENSWRCHVLWGF
jgi:hypothetical protein